MDRHILWVCICLLTLIPTITKAGTSKDGDAGKQTDHIEQLNAVISGIRGMVQVRQSESDPWITAQGGMKLSQGAEFRTGLRSAVQLKIPPDQIITLDRLGTMKLLTAIAQNNIVKTDLGMVYGRTRYDIQKAGIEHESTIRSTSATIAIRGTRVGIQDGAFGFTAWSTQSRARLTNNINRKIMTFGENTQVETQSVSAAENLKQMTTLDPGDINARDGGEILAIAQNPGTVVNPGQNDFQSPPPIPQEQLQYPEQVFVPRQLLFNINWNSTATTGYADLNLTVAPPINGIDNVVSINPSNTPYYAFSATSTPTGGTHLYTDGDNAGDWGFEVIHWPTSFPEGTYTVGVTGYAVDNDTDGKSFKITSIVRESISTSNASLEIEGIAHQNKINLYELHVTADSISATYKGSFDY